MSQGHVTRDQIDGYVTKLLKLRENYACPPIEGYEDQLQKGKDQEAIAALRYAHHLVGNLVAWAINHQIGRVLHDPGTTKTDTKDDAESAEQSFPDDPLYELIGERYRAEEANAEINRRILGCLLFFNPGFLPSDLASQATMGLQALDMGEIQPLFQKTVTGKHGLPYTLAYTRLRALEHVEFRRGCEGLTDEKALEHVAEEYGVGLNTVKAWRVQLSKTLGKNVVKESEATARKRGQYAKQLKEEFFRNKGEPDPMLDFALEFYGEDALERDAKEHRRAVKDGAE